MGAVLIQAAWISLCLAAAIWQLLRDCDGCLQIVVFSVIRKPDSHYCSSAEWAHWISLCPPQNTAQAKLVVTGQSRRHILTGILADGAAAVGLCGHFWALQHVVER